jgi:hypothetical protein
MLIGSSDIATARIARELGRLGRTQRFPPRSTTYRLPSAGAIGVRPGRGRSFLSGRATFGARPNFVYTENTMTESSLEQSESRLGHFGKHVLAGLLVLIVALILLKIIIGIIAALFFPVIAIVAILALIWAVRVLL